MSAGSDRDNAPSARLSLILCAAGVVYFFAQSAYYYANANFYGVGLGYLVNCLDFTPRDYLRLFVLSTPFYPPLYYLSVYVIYLVFGVNYLAMVHVMTLFIVGGAVYLYFAAKLIAGRRAAVVAFLSFLLFPGTLIFTKTLIIEQILLLLVPATLYYGLRTSSFWKWKYCVILGIVCGLGMLSKWSFLAYAAPVIVYLVFNEVVDLQPPYFKRPNAIQVRNFLLFLAVTGLVCAPWYLLSFDPELFARSAKNDPTFPEYTFIGNVVCNLKMLWEIVGACGVIGLVVLMAANLITGSKRGHLIVMAAFLLALPVLAFSVPGHLEDRYLWPAFPFLALVLGVCVELFKGDGGSGAVRSALGAALIAALLGWNLHSYLAERHPLEHPQINRVYAGGRLFWLRSDADHVLEAIRELASPVGEKIVRVASHPMMKNPHISYEHFQYYRAKSARFDRLDFKSYIPYMLPQFIDEVRSGGVDVLLVCRDKWQWYTSPQFDISQDPFQGIMSHDYVDQSMRTVYRRITVEELLADIAYLDREFRIARKLDLPGDYQVWIMVSPAFDAQIASASGALPQ